MGKLIPLWFHDDDRLHATPPKTREEFKRMMMRNHPSNRNRETTMKITFAVQLDVTKTDGPVLDDDDVTSNLRQWIDEQLSTTMDVDETTYDVNVTSVIEQ